MKPAQTGTVSGSFLLFLAFLVLKLTGFIAWSWWWVTAPLWAPAAIVLAVLTLGAMGFLIHHLLPRKRARK